MLQCIAKKKGLVYDCYMPMEQNLVLELVIILFLYEFKKILLGTKSIYQRTKSLGTKSPKASST